MPESTERRLAKLEEQLALQEQRMQALLSRKGGYIEGLLRLTGDVYANGNEAGLQHRENWWQGWTEHFDGDSRPAGWALAGAPFVAPTSESYTIYPSILTLGLPAGPARTFLYTTTFTLSSILALVSGFTTSATGVFVGVRADDGTDSNYVEGGYYMVNGTSRPQVWEYRHRYRIGGGAVVNQSGSSHSHSFRADVPFLNVGGTLWTSWYSQVLVGNNPTTTIWNTGSVSDLTWTPARKGIVVENPTASSWFVFCVDAVRI